MALLSPKFRESEDDALPAAKRPRCLLADVDDWDILSTLSTDLPNTPSPYAEIGDDDETTCEMISNFSKEETLMVFDWDDTILPTFWLAAQGLNLQPSAVVSDEQETDLAVLAQWASETLKVAKILGNVIIVTNAEDGWIPLTCQKFMPALVDTLENVKILSARSTYEPLGILLPAEWKIHAFEKEVDMFCQGLCPGRRANIVSIGDSLHEREALFRATSIRPECCSKSVKFIVRPTLEQLTREHEEFCLDLRQIVSQDGHVDLFLPKP